MSTSTIPSSSGRIFELDSLRGLAALAVVVYHHGSHFHVFPLATLLTPLYRDGWRAVDFFFVLSGFVLARAYWTPERKDRLGRNVRDRIGRLYPLHLLTLVVVALAQGYLTLGLGRSYFVYQINDGLHFVLNLFLVHGFDSSFNGPSWSISTEFVINLVFFVVILLPRRLALGVFVLFVVLTVAPQASDIEIATPFVRTLRGFCVGVLLYRAFLIVGRMQGPWLLLAADVTFVLSLGGAIAYVYLFDGTYLGGGIMLLLFSFMILSAPISQIAAWGLRSSPLVYLGEISYSVYLVHFPLQLALWLVYVTIGLKWPLGDVAGLIAFLGLTIASAGATYRYVELPGKRLLRPQRKRYVDATA